MRVVNARALLINGCQNEQVQLKLQQQYFSFRRRINPCMWICPYLWCSESVFSAYDRPAAAGLKLGSPNIPRHWAKGARRTKYRLHGKPDIWSVCTTYAGWFQAVQHTASWWIVSFTALTLADHLSEDLHDWSYQVLRLHIPLTSAYDMSDMRQYSSFESVHSMPALHNETHEAKYEGKYVYIGGVKTTCSLA